MKVRICYTVEVDDDFRRGINRFYGRPGLADREAVKNWFEAYGASMNDDIMWTEQKAAEREEMNGEN